MGEEEKKDKTDVGKGILKPSIFSNEFFEPVCHW